MKLTDGSFLVYAAKHYDNPSCVGDDEFYEDLKHFRYVKRLFNKYLQTGELKERLILNHIVVIFNVFQREAAVAMLFLKLRGYEELLKPFLVALSLMPERVDGIEGTVRASDIGMDPVIVDALRNALYAR